MRRSGILTLGLGVLLAAGLAPFFVRPPGPGEVYRFRSDQYGLPEQTAILLRRGECLVLSRSEADIGAADAMPGSEARLYRIAGTKRIRSAREGDSLYLVDERSGLTARPGEAIDGEILFGPGIGGLKGAIELGWPVGPGCGRGLARVFRISRVHR